ncbi:carbohydrate ABC transporter permease [Gordoniibacillus kamchatkensis]|uniref:carbohydrate ABC transporter permease n=1 Tax=Gordoniibacillus kamchatkensis TaxID=1590651 RepID=UPI001E5E8445|nr:sugar ABC transporter permease [Paenibacillus sp. VKM B-2647]
MLDERKQAKKRRFNPRTRGDYFWGYLMIAPTVLGLLVFSIWPVFQTLYFSFTSWGSFGNYEWTGTDNYKAMFADPMFWMALRNTFIYTCVTIPCAIALSIVAAVLLNQKIRGVTLYRTLYFLPVVTMPSAVAMVWKWLYNADYGLINYLLGAIGIKGPSWLTDPDIALYSMVIVAVWAAIGNNMVIFLSGLQGIPVSYYEAAAIDGAGSFKNFIFITLPLLTPTIFFVTIISLIGAFQVFDLVFMMIGPNSIVIEQTQSVVFLFYKNAFMLNNKGYAAAIAMVLFVIILLVTIVQMKLQKKWVHYS